MIDLNELFSKLNEGLPEKLLLDLAVLAERFGDEVLSLTPDQALEKSIQTQHSLSVGLSEQYMKLALVLEKRQTYKQRAF